MIPSIAERFEYFLYLYDLIATKIDINISMKKIKSVDITPMLLYLGRIAIANNNKGKLRFLINIDKAKNLDVEEESFSSCRSKIFPKIARVEH